MRLYDYGEEFEEIWKDLKDKRDGRKATAYKIHLRTKRDMQKKLDEALELIKELKGERE